MSPAELEHGIPLFLAQLTTTLRYEKRAPKQDGLITPALEESRRAATLHGKELLDAGFTIDQVVHDYGDVCQAITELAHERNVSIAVAEYQTFNRLLDHAIAAAVSSYGQHRDASISAEGAQDLHEQLGTLADQQRKLLDTALKALDAIKVGNIGVLGATGTLLEDSLVRLRELIDKSLPEIRLSTGMISTPIEPE